MMSAEQFLLDWPHDQKWPPDSQEICRAMEAYAEHCTAAKTVEHQKQMFCIHAHTRGGNDYLECADCGFEWDYRKGNPPIMDALSSLQAKERETRNSTLDEVISLLRTRADGFFANTHPDASEYTKGVIGADFRSTTQVG